MLVHTNDIVSDSVQKEILFSVARQISGNLRQPVCAINFSPSRRRNDRHRDSYRHICICVCIYIYMYISLSRACVLAHARILRRVASLNIRNDFRHARKSSPRTHRRTLAIHLSDRPRYDQLGSRHLEPERYRDSYTNG